MSTAQFPLRFLLSCAFRDRRDKRARFCRQTCLWTICVLLPMVGSLLAGPPLSAWAVALLGGVFSGILALLPALSRRAADSTGPWFVLWMMGLVLIQLIVNLLTPVPPGSVLANFGGWLLCRGLPLVLQEVAMGRLFYLWLQMWQQTLDHIGSLTGPERLMLEAGLDAARTRRRLHQTLAPAGVTASPRKRI